MSVQRRATTPAGKLHVWAIISDRLVAVLEKYLIVAC